MGSIAASLSLGLLLATGTSAVAQPPLGPGGMLQAAVREARAIDALFSQAESARLNGNCAQRDALLNQAGLKAADGGTAGFFGPDALDAYARRLSEARARPCPPSGGTTPPPPPPAGTVQPPQPTETGSPPPDGSILDVMDDSPAPVTSAPTPAPTPLGLEGRRIMNQVENDFTAAENARSAGGCTTRDDALNRIRNAIDAWAGSGLIDAGLIENWRARLAAARALPCPPPGAAADRRVGFLFRGGFGEMTIPRTNYGFQRDGAVGASPERPAAFSERGVPVFVLEGGVQFRGVGSFTLGYREGDASNRTEIPTSTTGGARGYPYIATGASGSTGIGGNVAMAVDTDVDVQEFGFRYRYLLDGPLHQAMEDANEISGQQLFLEAWGALRGTDHRGVVSITTPVIATQTIDQDLDESELGIGVGGRAIMPLSAGIRFSVGAGAGLYYYDFDLNSVQTNDQNFGPAADRAFTTTLDHGRSGIGYRGDATAELGVDLSRPLELFVSGQANYFSHRGRIENPFSGDFVLAGGTTFLDTDDGFDWQINIGLRMELRGPNFR